MRKKAYAIPFIIIFGLLSGCSTVPTTPSTPIPEVPPAEPVAVPAPEGMAITPAPRKNIYNLILVDHVSYQYFYDPSIRSARYVRYVGDARHLRRRIATRSEKFREDPVLVERKLPYVKKDDYKGTGYDRGHLAPAADFTSSQKDMDKTFYMSNMTPQRPYLNRKAWKALETKVRRWICGEERVLVLTGPIFPNKPLKFRNGMPIPTQFFKIVVDQTPPQKTIAFIYNQTDSTDVMEKRVASIAEIEAKTKLHFDEELPPEARPRLRAPSSFNEWKEKDCGSI